MKRERATQALGFAAIIVGGIGMGARTWEMTRGTPAEVPVILVSALILAATALWARRTIKDDQPPTSEDQDGSPETGKTR